MCMYRQYYDGKLVEGLGAPMDVINPATGQVVGTVGCALRPNRREKR